MGDANREALHLRIREIVNHFDPVRLIACGCPDDEYDPEIRPILRRLESGLVKDERQFGDCVRRIFVLKFDEDMTGRHDCDYRELARAIMAAHQTHAGL